MSAISSQVGSVMGVMGMVSLLVSGMIVLHLIQQAFERDGVVWGLISVLFPVGTYLFCRKHWNAYRGPFLLATGLFILYAVFWLIVKFI